MSARTSLRAGGTRLALGLAGAAVALGLAACGPFDSTYAWSDDFEGPLCAGAPCGWSRLAGPAEGARWGETLPGEHGLVLSGNGVIVSVEPALTVVNGTSDFNVVLDLIARCDLGSTLAVEIGTTEDFTGELLEYEPMLNVLTSWSSPRPNASRLGNGIDNLRSIDTITISKSGDGVCEVDFVGLIDDTFRF
jgi:hypothetical protein